MFFALTVVPESTFRLPAERQALRLTRAALGAADDLADGAARTTLLCSHDNGDTFYPVCSLIPFRTDQESLDITFDSKLVVLFAVKGPNKITVMGNFVAEPLQLAELSKRPAKRSAELKAESEPPTKKAESIQEDHANGLKVTLLSPRAEVGDHERIKKNDYVTVFYIGRVKGRKEAFDMSTTDAFGFTIGRGDVIAGWEQGLLGLAVEERVKLTIPPALGYGSAGHPPKIPSNSTLEFEIQIVSRRGPRTKQNPRKQSGKQRPSAVNNRS